jgi:hypothetical protein
MIFRLIDKTEVLSSAYSKAGDVYNVGDLGCDSFSVICEADVNTPAAVIVASAEITFASCNFESVAHGLTNGLKVQVSTSGTLPSGISALIDYFVIVVDDDNFKLAANLANALAGTALTLTNAGVGNQTVTPVALAGASLKLEQANELDGPWVALGSATNITVDADFILEKDRPTTRFIRAYLTLTAGNISANLYVIGKGDRQ